MIRSVVAIGGPPGSGKSTAGRRVAQTLHLDYRSVGDVFRGEAAARGFTLEEFGRYAEGHAEVDRELDRSMQALARPGVLLDGRIQGALCRRRGTPVASLVVTASREERARRVAARDHLSVESAARAIELREASERARYREIYGIDLDAESADLTVDSTSTPVDGVVAQLVAFLRRTAGADG